MKAKKGLLPSTLCKSFVGLSLHLKHTDQFLCEVISLSQLIHSIDEAQIIYHLSIPTGYVN